MRARKYTTWLLSICVFFNEKDIPFMFLNQWGGGFLLKFHMSPITPHKIVKIYTHLCTHTHMSLYNGTIKSIVAFVYLYILSSSPRQKNTLVGESRERSI
mmetsp:Transcript_18209/g.27007  ORF Transcript_18209/g.27007 Transcript_18209/m.27007 type:complete len:100 (+) Transcript_18209:76-375(+)